MVRDSEDIVYDAGRSEGPMRRAKGPLSCQSCTTNLMDLLYCELQGLRSLSSRVQSPGARPRNARVAHASYPGG